MVSNETKTLINDLKYNYRVKKILLSGIPENDKRLLLEAEKAYSLARLENLVKSEEDPY